MESENGKQLRQLLFITLEIRETPQKIIVIISEINHPWQKRVALAHTFLYRQMAKQLSPSR